ncbi:hypothetical protein [Pseudonocardia lacus]|uniref:arsenate reductase/protein-tyrosine-phosphatase family protein n=1 Tax=Pseudonocardia lacus TaxID=2835865 RepID=UPI001BDCAED1|nr:hypothetical protein [Pseudonocardia lacus]
MGEHDTFRLLFVCTGNVCRSPFAEILTRHLLVGRLGGRAAAAFDVRSAGVRAVVGAAMDPLSRAELAPWHLDTTVAAGFTARQLRPEMLAEADLVLGASTRHRSSALRLNPAALATAFSVREFARLAATVAPTELHGGPTARMRALVDAVRNRRGTLPPPDDDSVPDPMGRPAQAHHEAAELIRRAVQTVVDVVAPPLRTTRPTAGR